MECFRTGVRVNNMAVRVVAILSLLLEDTEDTEDDNFGDDEAVVAFIAASIVREERVRIQSYTEQIVPHYLLDDFKRFFRVSRSTFEILYENISAYGDLAPGWTGGREPIPIDKQLLMMLWYVSSHETLNRIADRFNVTESSMVRTRDRLFSVFIEHLKEEENILATGK
ncbi:uncharacterized protein LOC110466011 [Mizuhopecten yessoensis]|uniref:uncharacterized protein LOC110466011 n=1 Tax=Mizuhopecten yessoensis TaxID=6573 RepID=UPI000B45A62E|nr:uncharacterized protein LOC110466011 [Mizuhopecten yessoensis]